MKLTAVNTTVPIAASWIKDTVTVVSYGGNDWVHRGTSPQLPSTE
jgi:hypothetical protein